MTSQSIETVFTQEVHNKYLVFNTLFSRLPYDKMTKIGQLMPFLYDTAKAGFEGGKSPKEIIDEFFDRFTAIRTDKERIDLLFRLITYIERQVVLFDSVEDAAFEKLNATNRTGTLDSVLALAKQENKLEEVKAKLRNFRVRMVFTAHPTQFYPNSVLRIIQDLEKSIQRNDINEIDLLLQQLGKTPFINDNPPTPVDEAQSILFYLRHVYYEAIGQLHEVIYSKIFEENEPFRPILELGFWPGGDRDGNPYVTADVTRKVAMDLRIVILKSYYNHFKDIRRRFTFKGVIPLLTQINNRIYTNMFGLENDLRTEELMQRLLEVRQLVVEKHNSMFINELDKFIRQVELFGLYFASLDIRQDSSIHTKVMEAVATRLVPDDPEPYGSWAVSKKIQFLTAIQQPLESIEFEDPLVTDTFKTIRTIFDIQQFNGEKACHRYIISNSTSAASVLEVLAMCRLAGFADEAIKLDIVPLFETIEGLTEAPEAMFSLYNLAWYQAHLKRRGNYQTIMLGFSDGTKDGGYLKANWEIYKAKEKLTYVSKINSVSVLFFDGRGGPPARGGGKTHQFYASQGPTIANNEIQITIQGQTISSMYGSLNQALFNFEQLLSAGIINDLFTDSKSILDDYEKRLIEELAEIGGEAYLKLKNHPKFVAYLEHKSPLKYYGKTKIGSRPTRRSTDAALKLSDLRAIPFVGAWSQLKQNIPGYFGLGAALQQKIEEGKLHELQALYANSLYFKTLVQNSMMALLKSYFTLTSYMRHDATFGEFWQLLEKEYVQTKRNLLLVSGQSRLLENEPLTQLSVSYREDIVLPLLAIQQYALQRVEGAQDETERTIFEKMVTRSLFGNINASRNSA